MKGDLRADTIRIRGHEGDEIKAYLAQPLDAGKVGGVLVIHHMPGWDESTKEITRRFAAEGYLAICPSLHHREGPDASPDDAAAAARAKGGVPDDRFLGDAGGAIAHLRSLPASNGKVGVIGYCSGGRQSFLAACTLDLDAAVDCYGAFVIAKPPENMPVRFTPVIDRAKDLRCPLLGLFGAEDQYPTTAEVAEIEAELKAHAKTYDFHVFEGTGHAFFSPDRPSYRVAAAVEGWKLIFDWFGRYLA